MAVDVKVNSLDPAIRTNVDSWLKGNYDDETKAIILKLIQENPKELTDAFYTTLSFGTGGLRGLMGVGSNRMNQYTVRAATQGLANYLTKQPKPPQGHSVLIGYDSRHHSKFFAEEAAKVMAANQIKTYFFTDLRPTPLVSFGCRYKHCSAAIMVTASHNPSQYNGYKVYWNDGAQVVPPHDLNIINEVNLIRDNSQVKCVDSLTHPLIVLIDEEIDKVYLNVVSKLQLYPNENKNEGHSLKVVYSNLHGTGNTLVSKLLPAWGFSNISQVESQKMPDGSFPTVKQPNPEEKEALKLGIELLESTQGDIFIATDPDADRVGVVVRHQGESVILNGNQIACLCLEHICNSLTKQKKMSERAACIKTIGTTELYQSIADTYGVACFNVLTGFKYIAEKIREWENDPKGHHYIFGAEESYGYLLGTQSRDKDAVLSSALICEMALQAKKQGKTLIDLLNTLYQKHGVFVEKLLSLNFEESKAGKEKMSESMKQLRKNPPKTMLGIPVVVLEDYQNSLKKDLLSGKTEPITLPKSDVLLFWLEDRSKVMIRPSGTEPKVKLYCGVVTEPGRSILESRQEAEEKAGKLLEDLKRHL